METHTVPRQPLRKTYKSTVFYPQGELVDTFFKTDASPTWSGIEYGLDLLEQGIIWGVGDGSKIQIWTDPGYSGPLH